MGQRRVLMAIASLLAAIALVVAGCGGSQPDSEPTGTDNEETAPPEAQDVIITGLETMFTWFPARDSSTLDAYDRALPFLGQALRDGANNRVERGNSVWWQEWKAKKAEVTADALLVAAEHPEDKPDTVQRAVTLTQTVKTPDGKELDKSTFQIERVVAKKGPQGWRVEEINFFPENEYRTQICPPGQSHQPPPDGPCAPNPPPPPKQCPDGTTVPADQVCPPSPTGPQTKQCPDGTTVPAGTACPGPTPPQTKECSDGTTIPTDQTCPTTTSPTPETKQCPDGTNVPADQECPPVECPDGTTVPNGQTCPPVECPDGTAVPNGQTCPPVECPDGTAVPNGQTCPPVECPDGTAVPNGQTCPPVQCPDGTAVPNGQTCPPTKDCYGQQIPADEVCVGSGPIFDPRPRDDDGVEVWSNPIGPAPPSSARAVSSRAAHSGSGSRESSAIAVKTDRPVERIDGRRQCFGIRVALRLLVVVHLL